MKCGISWTLEKPGTALRPPGTSKLRHGPNFIPNRGYTWPMMAIMPVGRHIADAIVCTLELLQNVLPGPLKQLPKTMDHVPSILGLRANIWGTLEVQDSLIVVFSPVRSEHGCL